MDMESRESGAGVVDVPADRRHLSAADSLGHVQVGQGTDGRADDAAHQSGGFRERSNRVARDRRHLDAAGIRDIEAKSVWTIDSLSWLWVSFAEAPIRVGVVRERPVESLSR